MKISGIYKIQSLIKPNRCYIGSGMNLHKRWQQHLTNLRRNKHNPKIQAHYNKYGESDLIFIILESCLPSFLIIREQHYIDTLKPFFNIRILADSNYGIKASDKAKHNLRISHLGYKLTEEQKKKISNALKGRKKPEGFSERLRVANTGKKLTEETKQKIREKKLGISTGKGRKASEETKTKLRIANLGKKVSAETKRKMSESNKIRWNNVKKLKAV